MLECLRNIWGSNILLNRDNIYKVVSGDVSDSEWRNIVCTYYKTHAAFANYVDRVMFFGRRDIPFIKRFTLETRQYLNAYVNYIDDAVNTYAGSKFLLDTNEYRYYAVEKVCDLSQIEGVTYIR